MTARPATTILVLACAFVLLARTATAQQSQETPPEDNWESICKSVKAQPLQLPTLTGPLTAEQLAKCDEQILYYGMTGKPNYAAALQCGLWQRAHPQPEIGNMFYGPGVLTMLYVNGRGAPRNYDLAIRFACENTWTAPAEMSYRIGHLEQLRRTAATTSSFDLCDDITSGLSQGACTALESRKLLVRRNARIDAERAKLPPAAQQMLPALQKAESAFEQARSRNEVDLSGTARAAFAINEEDMLADQFLINLQRFAKGDIPPAGAAELAQLDGRLNTAYQTLQRAPTDEGSTITAAGIRETERTWLKLADAWVAFARVAYPQLSETAVRAQLIRLRLHQLISLGGGGNPR